MISHVSLTIGVKKDQGLSSSLKTNEVSSDI